MLKFATKKPPRLKHSDQVKTSAPLDNHGRVFIDDSSSYLTGNYTRFERINGDDMIDSDHQKVEYIRSVQDEGPEYLENKENGRDQIRGRTVSPANVHWKAYNVKYGKVGVEKELDFSDTSPVRQVGMSRNTVGTRSGTQQVDQGQRSQVNPGYIDNTLENRKPYDVNRNFNQEGMYNSRNYSKGSGYHFPPSGGHYDEARSHDNERSRSHGYGHDYNGNQQHQVHTQRLQHENPFPAPSFSTDSNGTPYCADSMGSMSIDSLSTSGDRSSKSVSETPDYDVLIDLPQHTKHGLDMKPPVHHKHRHVHIGRGTHGVCEGSVSPTRPGSSECSMTSSLRKSPSGMKSGHHVRWGPGVVNSHAQPHEAMQRSRGQGQIQSQYAAPPVSKKSKKKSSLRSLLNLPKFPLSDDESTDSTLDGQGPPRTKKEYNGTSENVAHRGTLRKLLDYRPRKRATQLAVSQPVVTTELASLKYKRDYQHGDSSITASDKALGQRPPLTKLNITEANSQYPLNYDYEYLEPMDSISYPIMHSGKDSSIFRNENLNEIKIRPDTNNRSPVNSVRPFLINGQSSEIQDYDYFTDRESKPQTSEVISVNLNDKTEVNALHQARVSVPQSYDIQTRTTNVLQTTPPFATATFDTYVTLGRPNESSVTFDTFVTHGRPYATSTPIPNGSIANTSNVSQDYLYRGAGDFSDPRRVNIHSSGLSGTSGHIGANVTQTWNYSVPGSQHSTAPMATHSVWTRSKESAMHPGSHTGMTSVARSPEGPYDLENRVYGKLSPPSSYITSSGEMGVHVTQSTNFGNNSNVLDLLGQRSGSQTISDKQIENMQFKDTCKYREKDTGDYDDDVFLNLGLNPNVIGKSGAVRRKLDFAEENSAKVVTSCVPQLNHDLNQDDTLNHNYSGFPKVQVVPGIAQQRGTMSSNLNDNEESGEVACILDLVYITERIISMSFASEEHDNTYKYNLKEVTRMLKTKHGENYLVINISEKKPDLAKHCPQVFDYGWPDNLAPPLERLCGICKAIDQWMSTDPNHVVVVHCKGGRGRIAVVIAAYMRYSNICASADQALDRFAMKRFYDDKLGGLPQPSQRRYVHYFAGLLSGAIQINSSALYLHHILIHGVPNFDTRGGCRPFIKVYQGMHPIFTSGVYNVTDNMQKVCISISPGIPLRGDILIKCYHKKNNAGQREMMWGCQFHTCAISHNSLVFSKNELDFAIGDPRFPEPGKVEFVFGNNSEGLVQVADFKSDVTVPVDDTTEGITRWDSYENFGKSADGKETDVNANGLQSSHQQQGVDNFRVTQLDHSQGPVDGSLYAQISKRKLESQIIQNGSTKLQNGGSYSSSIDSVPMGTSTTHKSSSESWSYNKSERDFHQPNLSHSSMNKSYSSSTSPRSGKVALDEQTQLDQILSDLLNDQAFVSQKSAPGTRSFKTVEEHRSPEGNVVVQRGDVTYKLPEVRTEKHYTVKTETKTLQDDKYKPVNAFTYTPSSPEMSRSFEPLRSPQSPKAPNRSDYEKNYKKESYNYQSNGPSSLSDGEQSLSWLQQQQAKMREKSTERDPNRQRNEQMLIQELKKSQTQNKYYQKHTQSEDESSTKVASPLQNGPASPYSYTVSRTHTYNTEKSPTENGFRPHDTLPVAASHTTYITEQSSTSKVSNKPPPSPNLQRTVTPTLNSPPVPPPQRTSSRDYMQHQTQHQTQQQQTQQTRNRTYSGGAYQQSSSSWKGETHTQPRVIQRHNSESAYDRDHYERQERQHESRQQFKTPPLSPRSVSPHTFQTYKTVYKTIHHDEPDFSQPQPVEVKFEKQTQKEQQTVQDVNKPHYITEVIVQRTGGSDSKNSTLSRSEREKQETDNRLEALEKSLQAASHSIMASTPWQQQQQLQQQQQQQLQQQQNVIKQEVRQFETRSYETKTEQRQEQRHEQQRVSREDVNGGGYPRSMSPVWDNFPTEHIQQSHSEAPKKIEITEEDRITLKPIGPGVQQLEPEGSIHSTSTLGRDSTLGRATTPNFPTSPSASAEHIIQAVHEKARRMSIGSSNQSLNSIGGYLATPPFPVTPRTPYTNISAATSQFHPQGYAAPRSQQSPFGFGSSTRSLGPYSSQQSLNSVFEREETDRDRYNTIVSRQLMHSAHDPTYASITDTSIGNAKAGGNLVSPTGTLQSDKMQFQNQYQQHQSYQTSTLPHSTSGPVSQPFQSNTLPHQTSLNQQQLQQQQLQQQQQQQQQFQQRQYQTYQSSSSQQHHHTQQYSSSNTHQDGSLQIDTNPRMLMTQPARSPSSPGSPPSPGNLNTLRQQLHVGHNMSNSAVSPGPHSATGQSSPSVYFGLSRRGSLTSLADTEAVHTTPRFVKDTSKYWYKPNISREEAIIMLKDKAPGTFVVRDSNSFPGAFGLALKVATLPPNVQTKSTGDPQADLVRHFLIEPTSKGVRLRGCSNEPVFGSLASLVYQHSITPLALPCKLVLPEHDSAHIVSESSSTLEMPNSASQLLSQGAACNVVYLNSVDTESLTGPQAVAKACKVTYDNPPPKTTHVHFKVSNQGITLTDNQRKLFFRRHYPVAAVTYCGGDPEDRKWKRDTDVPGVQADSRVFGFVARKQGSISDNCCHLFAELDPDQPASAIVNFVTKVMIGQGKIKS